MNKCVVHLCTMLYAHVCKLLNIFLNISGLQLIMILVLYLPAVLSSSMSKLPMPPIFPSEGICIPPPNIVEPICVEEEDDDELLIIEEEDILDDDDIILDMSPDINEPKNQSDFNYTSMFKELLNI